MTTSGTIPESVKWAPEPYRVTPAHIKERFRRGLWRSLISRPLFTIADIWKWRRDGTYLRYRYWIKWSNIATGVRRSPDGQNYNPSRTITGNSGHIKEHV